MDDYSSCIRIKFVVDLIYLLTTTTTTTIIIIKLVLLWRLIHPGNVNDKKFKLFHYCNLVHPDCGVVRGSEAYALMCLVIML